MSGFHILVVDDEPAQRDLVAGFLRKQGFAISEAGEASQALDVLRRSTVDLLLTDVRMAGTSGLELLRQAKGLNPELAAVLMTAYGNIGDAVAAMKAGADDYLTKPIDLEALLRLIGRLRERQQLLAENRELREQLRGRSRIEGIVAESGKMREVLSVVHRVARSTATILIQGESGTGKELIARAIHALSPRAEASLVTVNCAALPETLLESELFGHVRGAFTGAAADKVGRFEKADGGSIFLDEIGDVSLAVQAKLLRVVQEREFERVGSNRTIRVDVRIIAATNQDLGVAVREKRFREDLYFRLSVVPIWMPPLRDRREDIPPLLDHFLRKAAAENGKAIRGFSREARDLLLKYDYPGNVRELENLIERAVVLSRGDVIGPEDLPPHVSEGAGEPPPPNGSLPAQVLELERRLVGEALERAAGVQTRAAELLGISERVLRYKLKKLGLKADPDGGT